MSPSRGTVNAFYRGGRAVPAIEGQAVSSSRVCCGMPNEISAVTNQFVNSYKRLWGGDEAPSFMRASGDARAPRGRVPALQAATGSVVPCGYRARSAASPYLSLPSCSPPVSKGIEDEYERPAEAEDNVCAR